MTQVIILKAFKGKHGDFHPSPKPVHMEANYASECKKNGLVRFADETPQPSRKQAMPGAPSEKKPGESDRPLGDGKEQSPLSSRAARASQKKTSTRSGGGVTLK